MFSMTTRSVGLLQSALFGGDRGTSFNDIEKVIGLANITDNIGNPIKRITIYHGRIIDGIKVTYHKYDPASHSATGSTTTVYHGTSSTDNDSNLRSSVIDLSGTASLIAISGKQGGPKIYGHRIAQLSFAIYDSSTGKLSIAGPFGGEEGTPFRVTANSNFIGFGGYAVDTDSSAWQNKQGGLHGLTFFDVPYCKF